MNVLLSKLIGAGNSGLLAKKKKKEIVSPRGTSERLKTIGSSLLRSHASSLCYLRAAGDEPQLCVTDDGDDPRNANKPRVSRANARRKQTALLPQNLKERFNPHPLITTRPPLLLLQAARLGLLFHCWAPALQREKKISEAWPTLE